jgi:Zn ribbon nucleic-acid-binding protein
MTRHVLGAFCPQCPHVMIVEAIVHGVAVWTCAYCGYQWRPTDKEIAQLRDVE